MKKNYKKENEILEKKLLLAQKWMKREVQTQIKIILREKTKKETFDKKNDFFFENIENITKENINSFFGELMLLNISQEVIDNIISAEILLYNLSKSKLTDGLGIITSYHKSMDILIENLITKGFRKYAKKVGQTQLRKNNLLEKTLNSVVNKGYILGVPKLFHILSEIKNGNELFDYSTCFKNYLNKFSFIKDILLDDDFFNKYKEFISLELCGRKRHIGKVSYQDIKKGRNILVGDFKDKNCILYKLVEIGKVDL